MSSLRHQTLRALTATVLLLTFPAVASAEPPNWTDCVWKGEKYACMTVPQLKLVQTQYLELRKTVKQNTLLEEQLKLSQESVGKMTPILSDLVVQASASNHQLAELTKEMLRQDAERMDGWTLAAIIIGTVVLGYAGGTTTALLLKD